MGVVSSDGHILHSNKVFFCGNCRLTILQNEQPLKVQYWDQFGTESPLGQFRGTPLLNKYFINREKVVLDFFFTKFESAEKTWLDIGCSTGNLLNKISERFPEIELYGVDVDESKRNQVLRNSSVKAFYNNLAEVVSLDYGVISMLHVLNLLPNPKKYLMQIYSLMNEKTSLVILVPNFGNNIFTLAIGDQATLFAPIPFTNLLKNCGFEVMQTSTTLIPGEIIAILKKSTSQKRVKQRLKLRLKLPLSFKDQKKSKELVKAFEKSGSRLRTISERQDFLIFGTGITSTWVNTVTGGKTQGFVTEDEFSSDATFLGKKISSVNEIQGPIQIVMCLSSAKIGQASERFENRLIKNKFKYKKNWINESFCIFIILKID